MTERSTVVALARVANASFFLLTSLYCLLTYSSFAYQQFIRPHLINWLSGFVVWHHLGFWLALIITGWTLLPDLGRGGLHDGRGDLLHETHPGHKGWTASLLAWSYLAVSTVIGILLLVWPVLPQVENNGRGLALALAALLPPIWLAVFDHCRHLPAAATSVSSELRVWRALLLAGVVVWLGQLVAIPWRLDQTGEIRLSGEAISFGILMSGVGHLLMFAGLAFLIVVILRAKRFARVPGPAEYWLLAAAATVALSLIIDRQLFGAIAFRGAAAWAMSIVLAVMLVLTWSSIAFMTAERAETTAVEIWLAPMPGVRSRLASTLILTGLVLVQFALLAYVTPFDWDFVLLKLSVLVVWFAAFAYGFGALSNLARPLRWPSLAAPALAGVVLFAGVSLSQSRIGTWMGGADFVPDFALEGYVAVDPSYRFIHDTLRMESQEDAEFFAHLRAHSLIQHTSVDPIEIEFVSPQDIDQTRRAPHADFDSRLPNIFLFVIDSLRRDYLSAYNPAVTFTPGIGEFARDSVVFERAFTRYGGTGLAVPAIWTGGMLLHKQYVTPFDPMNTLLKLLEARHYRRLMSMDSIVVQLIEPPPPPDELDRDVPIMSYRLCQTLEDLKGKLTAGMRTRLQPGGESRPVFAYSLPQDLHISHIRSRPVPAGKSYPGFFAPVAAQVEEMDACFGRFVTFLKETGLYEQSVIVITSDHGDSLGEGLRWGHSYTMFPEVSRIPLIVRIPGPLQRRYRADPETVSLSTDLTPTFYALAGHMPRDLGPLYGRPLFVRHDSDLSARRHDPQLIASSYGGVYAVLRDNGTRLYIADGVNKREYAYDLHGEMARRVGVVPSERGPNRQFIRQQIDELARQYRFRLPE